jgi:hypothetical protein
MPSSVEDEERDDLVPGQSLQFVVPIGPLMSVCRYLPAQTPGSGLPSLRPDPHFAVTDDMRPEANWHISGQM